MASRNLARTVVEGGRHTFSKWERRLLRRRERRSACSDDAPRDHRRPPSCRGFADRLAPLHRWLASQAGRGWNNVYSEFCRRFDQRTLKGWHLKDHLLSAVDRGGRPWARFYVDARGILRGPDRRRSGNNRAC